MNKSSLVAIGGAIVGALLVVLYYVVIKPVPLPLACQGMPNCIVVRVIEVDKKAEIQPIGNFKRRGQGTIFWEIETAGYTFPNNGIQFNKPSHPAPGDEFPDCVVMPQTDSKKFKCGAKGTPGTYGYTVTLAGTPAVLPLDPFIINN